MIDWNSAPDENVAHMAWSGVALLIQATKGISDEDDSDIENRMGNASLSVTGNRPPDSVLTCADLRLMMLANLRQLVEELERIKTS